MLKQKYFLTNFFILSAEKQPIKSSWRKIEWLLSLLRLGAGLNDSIELPVMNRTLWASVFSMAQKQAVSGIMMDAVNRLAEAVKKPDRDLLLKLLGMEIEIEKRNRIVNGETVKWFEFFRMRGYKAVLLK